MFSIVILSKSKPWKKECREIIIIVEINSVLFWGLCKGHPYRIFLIKFFGEMCYYYKENKDGEVIKCHPFANFVLIVMFNCFFSLRYV